MLKYKNLNNISEELEKSIPAMDTLAVNGEVVFEMLNGHRNNDMDSSEREKNPVLYGKTQLDTYIRVVDPFSKKTVQVGAPMAIEGEVVQSYRPFLAGAHTDIFKGKFSLMCGNTQDQELFEVFWLSPQREGSPCADQRVRPLYRIVNHKEDTKKQLGRIGILREALDVVKNMNEEEIRMIGASQNFQETELDELTARVYEYTKSFPDKFLTLHSNPDTKIKANVKFAFDKNILVFDPATKKITLDDSELFTISKESMNDINGAVMVWIKSAKNGKSVYETILKQLSGDMVVV